jgi:glycosyltransferase involved in cell wall biosynthesis
LTLKEAVGIFASMHGDGGTVIFITGRDIVVEGKGGVSSYVRAHALAARRLGCHTHVFFVGDRDESRDTPYGRLHMVRNPAFPARWLRLSNNLHQLGFLEEFMNRFLKTPYTARIHASALNSAVLRLLHGVEGPVVIHTFYAWGVVGCRLRDELKARGVTVKTVNSVFTTMRHEIVWKIRGAGKTGDLPHLLTTWVEWSWMRLFGLASERRSLHSPDMLLYNYESVRRLYEAEYGTVAHSRKISYSTESALLPGSAEGEVPVGPLPANDVPVIASMSRHDPRKGIDILIRALTILASRGVAFKARIGSGGALLPWHRRLAGKLGLGSRIEFTGWLEDPGELYRACDIFVLPSLEEGSGAISLLEAMMHGKCIIASNIDGIPEDVRHGEEAWLVPPADPVALADALQALLSDDDLRRRLSAAARRRFMERFDPDVFIKELGEAYREG